MQTLILSDVYFPRVNGVSTSIQTITRELRALGDTVFTIAPDYPGAAPEPGLIRIASHRVPFDPEDRRMRYGDTVAAGERIENTLIDLIHIQTPFIAHYAGLELGRRRGLPVIATYHTLFGEYLHHYVRMLPRPLAKAVARHASRRQCNQLDAVIVPTSPIRDLLRGYGVRAPIHVLPTGIGQDWLAGGDGAAFRSRHGIEPGRPVLLFVGRVAHEKNIDFLLAVTRRVRQSHPDVLLVIAGEGPALASLRESAGRMGVASSVRFVGNLDREGELRDCFRAADVFVFASRTETQGLVLLEAMARGVPVVSIAEMGSRDVLREGHGCLIAPLDEVGFTDRVLAVLGDEALRGRLAAAAVEWARQWSAPELALRLQGIYRAVLRARGGAGALSGAETG